jgi:hypothetical protein
MSHKEAIMYAVTRRYQFDPNESEEINRQVQEGLVPLIRTVSGFVAYYWLDTGEGAGTSLTVFENKVGAEESVRLTADYEQKQLAPLSGKPSIIRGEVRAHAWGEAGLS